MNAVQSEHQCGQNCTGNGGLPGIKLRDTFEFKPLTRLQYENEK
jgi:hypothetical protein